MMDLATATRLVADDQRESYPEMTDTEAIEHARNTIAPDALDLTGTGVQQAYTAILNQR